MKIFINVTQEDMDHYKRWRNDPNRDSTNRVFKNCPLGRAFTREFGNHSCIVGSIYIKHRPYEMAEIARLPSDISAKSMNNCNYGNDKPFSFYIDIPKEWVKECSADVY